MCVEFITARAGERAAIPFSEEFRPGIECGCTGCVRFRHSGGESPAARRGRRRGARGARRALLLAAAAATAACAHLTPALAGEPPPSQGPPPRVTEVAPGSPQGAVAPLYGPPGPTATPLGGPPAPRPTTRAEIIERAEKWTRAKVPYAMDGYWSDGYRQDCSGFVSMAWNLGRSEWTGSLASVAERITKDDLQPGDILLFHNAENPEGGSHVTLFGGWTDSARTRYTAYEQTRPATRRQATPYAYWTNSARFLPYRYRGLAGGGRTDPSGPVRARPGADSSGPGTRNAHVTRLGQRLVARGGGRPHQDGPGPRRPEADRRATQAFQRPEGWRGSQADGLPAPVTWSYPAVGSGEGVAAGKAARPPGPPPSGTVPAHPGAALFRPGQSRPAVERPGWRPVAEGSGRHHRQGPGPRRPEADRRGTADFQRARGRRGKDADGCPGRETWRRLFS
ncbi:peptidoglycan-binding protein [Streptomyces diastaticus]|uniref:peptidoglycan-binding protein n=1 Tax=Streptomyces diastaticus TaxID=1956 RepID=UPI00368999C0